MKLKKVLFVIFGLLPLITFAQKGKTITIVVHDSITQRPVAHVNLTALKKAEIFSSKATDSLGRALIIANSEVTVLLVEGAGYETQHIPLPDSPQITLKLSLIKAAKSLAEVTIADRRQLVKVAVDKITYDVKNDPDKAHATTLEMLEKVPLISLGPNDAITVGGKKTYVILIDGKPSNILTADPSTVLRNLSANKVDQIEILTTPPSRYSQSGITEVINVITVNKRFQGLENDARSTYSTLYNLNENLMSQFKTGAIGISNYGNYLYSSPPASQVSGYLRSPFSETTQTGNSQQTAKNFVDIPEISIELDTLNLITASAELGTTPLSIHNSLSTSIYSNQLSTTSADLTTARASNTNTAYNFYYQHQGKRNKNRVLAIGYRLSNQSKQYRDTIITQSLSVAERNAQFNYNSVREQTVQADYAHPLANVTIETGMKGIFRTNGSFSTYLTSNGLTQSFQPAGTFPTTTLNNGQDVYMAYNSYYFKKGTWGVKIGLRYEGTVINGTGADGTYNNFIPVINLQKRFKKGLFTVSYDEDVNRPAIAQLNTFDNATNPTFVVQGNPNLTPEVTDKLEASYTFFGKTFFKITGYYYHTDHSIGSILTYPNDTTALISYENASTKNDAGLKLNLSYTIVKGLTANLNGRLSYVSYRFLDPTTNAIFVNRGAEFFETTNLGYSLKSGYRFNIYFRASSPYIQLQGRGFWWVDNSYGVSKRFDHDRLNLSLTLDDPFNPYRNRTYFVDQSSFASVRSLREPIRDGFISVAYRFGGLKASIKQSNKQINNNDLHIEP